MNFSPDGTLFFTSSKDGAPATYRVALDGAAPVLFARLLERAAVSPNGKLVAGVYRESPGGPTSLGVLSSADGTAVKLFPGYAPGLGTGQLTWSRDSSAVIYTGVERMNIWRQRLDGGAPEKITNFQDLVVARFALSPDAQSFVLSRGTLSRDAFLLTNFQ